MLAGEVWSDRSFKILLVALWSAVVHRAIFWLQSYTRLGSDHTKVSTLIAPLSANEQYATFGLTVRFTYAYVHFANKSGHEILARWIKVTNLS